MEAAFDVMKTGQAKLLHFGIADEMAWEVGLACGGSLDVFVHPFDANFFPYLRAAWMEEETKSVHITVIRAPSDILGHEMLVQEDGISIGNISSDWNEKALEFANETFSNGKSQRAVLDEETEIFLELISPTPTLIAVGGVHVTVALVSLAKALGYRTVVIDPRSVWGNEERFLHADLLVHAWPQEAFQQIKLTRSTAVVMLTHEAELDDPALKIALRSPAFYVGALGSKKTNAKRREGLLNDGMTQAQLAQLHAPIGLDIGAETPEEIALAIMSEIVKVYRKQEQPDVQHPADSYSTK
jgi:xanthine dehydrogenase accessory factor